MARPPSTNARIQKATATRRTNRLAADRRRAEAAGFNARGEQDWVPVEALFSDHRYQRDVDMARVQAMAAEFDPDAINQITVSERPGGRFAVLDGFHRVELMRYLGWADQKMPAFIYQGLTLAEEAALFRKLNADRRQPSRLVLFKSAVTAGDPDAVAMNEIFIRLGLSPSSGPGARNIRSLGKAEKIVKLAGPQVLEMTLTVMLGAWDGNDDALNGDLLSGIALLIYSTSVDPKHLRERLSDHTPGMVLNKAKVTKDVNSELTLPAAVATVVTSFYNSRLRAPQRLPQFGYRGWPKGIKASGAPYGYGWSDTDTDADADADE